MTPRTYLVRDCSSCGREHYVQFMPITHKLDQLMYEAGFTHTGRCPETGERLFMLFDDDDLPPPDAAIQSNNKGDSNGPDAK